MNGHTARSTLRADWIGDVASRVDKSKEHLTSNLNFQCGGDIVPSAGALRSDFLAQALTPRLHLPARQEISPLEPTCDKFRSVSFPGVRPRIVGALLHDNGPKLAIDSQTLC